MHMRMSDRKKDESMNETTYLSTYLPNEASKYASKFCSYAMDGYLYVLLSYCYIVTRYNIHGFKGRQ